MTREEQRFFRELKQAIKASLKTKAKEKNYKFVSETAYRIVDGYLYEVWVRAALDQRIKTKVSCKPLELDRIFWEVFEWGDPGKKRPITKHVNAGAMAVSHTLEEWHQPVESPEAVDAALDAIFQKSDAVIGAWSRRLQTVDDFEELLRGKTDPCSLLDRMLCDIAEGRYQEALRCAREEVEYGRLGIYMKLPGGDINEFIMRYCEKKLEKQGETVDKREKCDTINR